MNNYPLDHAMRDDGEYVYLLQQGASMVEISESWRAGESPAYTPWASAPNEVAVDADGILYYGSSTVLGVDGGGLRLIRTY